MLDVELVIPRQHAQHNTHSSSSSDRWQCFTVGITRFCWLKLLYYVSSVSSRTLLSSRSIGRCERTEHL